MSILALRRDLRVLLIQFCFLFYSESLRHRNHVGAVVVARMPSGGPRKGKSFAKSCIIACHVVVVDDSGASIVVGGGRGR